MKRIKTFFMGAGLLSVAVALARAWVPTGGAPRPDGPISVTVALNETAPTGAAGDLNAAATEAMTLWNAKLQRVQLTAAPLDGEAWYENGRNEMFFDRGMFGRAFPSGLLATTLTTEDRGVVVETDVVFNADERWGVYRGLGNRAPLDLRRVAVHELGHLLGLGHPDLAGQSVSAIMNTGITGIETPTADDEAGVRALYDFETRVPPVILSHPKPTKPFEGTVATLTVAAAGRGPFIYEWRRDGVVVAGATEARLNFTAGRGDTGAYMAVVRNAAGATSSEPAEVQVQLVTAAPSVDLGMRVPIFAEAGSNVVLTGVLRNSAGQTQFSWKKDGNVVPGATSMQLVLTDIQFSQAGAYTFTATNLAGSETTRPAQVSVTPLQPPRFTRDLPRSAVVPGGAITLSATGMAGGEVTYQWFKDGAEIAGATKATLALAQFGAADAGRYVVVMANSSGRLTSAEGELTAFEPAPLSIVRQPAAITEYAGATVSMEVEVAGAATSYQWFRDGVPVPGARGRVLFFPRLLSADAGRYLVEVSDGSNRVRSLSARLAVLVRGAPIIAQQPQTCAVLSNGGLVLSVSALAWRDPGVEASEYPAPTYQWMKDGASVPGQTTATFYRAQAQPGDAGRYWVQVSSPAGVTNSDPAEVAVVSTEAMIPQHPATAWVGGDEALRLASVAAEVERRRLIRAGRGSFYARGEVALPGYPSAPSNLPGTYTFTVNRGSEVATSRPFTLAYQWAGSPLITRHPQGGAYAAGEAATLRVTTLTAPGDVVTYQWFRNGERVGSGGPELVIPAFSVRDLGEYWVIASNALGPTSSESAILEFRQVRPPLIRSHPTGLTVADGEMAILSVATRGGEVQYQWFKDGRPMASATGAHIGFLAGVVNAGSYQVSVSDGISTAMSRSAQVKVLTASRAPEILVQPQDETFSLGSDAVLSAGADGAPLPTGYQWKKNGVDLPGATDAKLRLSAVTPDTAGAYSVVVTNTRGAVTSRAATVTIDTRGRLVNLATRAPVGRDGDILIAGFVIGGTESRQVLVRGIGDQLAEFGVSGVLRDPVVSLYDAKGKLLDSNDDWFLTGAAKMAELRAAAKQVGAFAQREDARDGALLATLAPGSYTVKVAGLANTTGVGLVEVYELGKPGKGRLINLSSRAVVGKGANILIPGLVLKGLTSRRLLIRAVGPGLADFGVAGTLADPVMTVFRDGAVVAQNDNWGEQANAANVALIRTTMAAVGAFALKDGSRDAALLLDLPPGSYTVQVAGVRDATGVALVEVYEVAP